MSTVEQERRREVGGVVLPPDVELWPFSDSLRPRQVEEWSVDEDNASLYASSVEKRREFLQYKAALLDWRNAGRYWRALGVPMRGRVLELGAGNFWLSTYLSAQPEVEEVVGVELSASRLLAFRELVMELFEGADRNKIRYAVGDMHRLNCPDNSFDAVTCDAVLHHADNLVSVLREAWRVLRPGGWFVALREPSISRLRPRPPRFHARFPEDGSAMYYYRDGWRSAFINSWYVNVHIVPFVEYGIVKGHRIRSWTVRRALRALDLRIPLRAFPKICIGAQKPL